MRHDLVAAILTTASLCAAGAAHAQTYPAKPVRLIIATPPGGGTDLLGRLFGPRLADRLGQPFIADNRGGAGGNIAAEAVAKAPPDGHTLLVTNMQLTATAAMEASLPFDVLKDLAPVGLIGRQAIVMGVHPGVPAKSVREFAALVRASPGKYSFTSCGQGTPLHLAGELFNISARLDLTHIPYKGCGPALLDVVSGQVPAFFTIIGNAVPYEKAGKLRILGVASLQRLPGYPDMPTIAEAGYQGFEAFPWFGIFAPAGTPGEVVAKLNAEITAAVQDRDIAEKLRGMQFEPATATAAGFADIVRLDLERWTRVVREAKIKAQ